MLGLAGLVALFASGPVTSADPPASVSTPIRDARVYAATGQYIDGTKIMGGSFAKAGDNPWQVALVLWSPNDGPRILFCGGSLIAPRLVITAAHCVDNKTQNTDLDVVVGALNLATDGQRIHVAHIWVDPNYNKAQAHADDVAILELSMDGIPQGRTVPLMGDDAGVAELTPVRVTGWGAPIHGAGAVRDLRTVDLRLISNLHCNDPVSYDNAIGPTMLCAGSDGAGKDSCQGDSGGPLTIDLHGTRTLMGVVSWGDDCGIADKYGVYARVAAIGWIQKCMNDTTQCVVKPAGTL